MRGIELLSPGWRPSIEPINYIRIDAPSPEGEGNWCAPEDLNLSSADLPVSQTPVT
jgi:hypothetical protein